MEQSKRKEEEEEERAAARHAWLMGSQTSLPFSNGGRAIVLSILLSILLSFSYCSS